MPKRKTHKGLQKRVKVTAKGKVKHHQAYTGHLMSSKTGKRKRHLSSAKIMNTTSARTAKTKL
jgi:large subunit ribosomal protein L35